MLSELETTSTVPAPGVRWPFAVQFGTLPQLNEVEYTPNMIFIRCSKSKQWISLSLIHCHIRISRTYGCKGPERVRFIVTGLPYHQKVLATMQCCSSARHYHDWEGLTATSRNIDWIQDAVEMEGVPVRLNPQNGPGLWSYSTVRLCKM